MPAGGSAVLGGQDPAGAVAHPKHLIAFDGGDEPDLGADPGLQVNRLVHMGDQDFKVWQGDSA